MTTKIRGHDEILPIIQRATVVENVVNSVFCYSLMYDICNKCPAQDRYLM